eukprot:scaffold5876_cov363-Chaetoceros_neogracile.AAC.6
MKQPELPITRPSKLASNSRASYHRAVWWRTCHCRVTTIDTANDTTTVTSNVTATFNPWISMPAYLKQEGREGGKRSPGPEEQTSVHFFSTNCGHLQIDGERTRNSA